jgi:hypothetical protein
MEDYGPRKTFRDGRGYARYIDSNRLVHRKVAYKHIYSKDKKKYPLNFSKYKVHHKDGDKLNNHPSNLQLVYSHEHEKLHGLERMEWGIIRILLVAICWLVAVIWWGNIVRHFELGIAVGGIGIVSLLGVAYLVIIFITKEKLNKKIIY